jgi:uncharacterized protein (TIGR03118 family)
MKPFFRLLVGAALLVVLLPGDSSPATAPRYRQVNLVADPGGPAALSTDPNLVNAWGLAFSPGHPFWVADNGTGVATLYDGQGNPQPLVVNLPAPQGGPAAPTGEVFNPTSDFDGDHFIFATEDGTILGWSGGTDAVIRVDDSGQGAIYKGLALARTRQGNLLYAADFHNGGVHVFDANYQPVGLFTDPNAPAGFAPFNVAAIHGLIYVTFAVQDEDAEDDVPGPGNGFVDVFTTDGNLVRRFATGTAAGGRLAALNSPWAVVAAHPRFLGFGNLNVPVLLVGNFGSGQIAAFEERRGIFLGVLRGTNGQPLAIDGLWALAFGGGGQSGDPNKLYFTAGPDDEQHGLFGRLELAR